MLVKDYLEGMKNENVTFTIMKTMKDEDTHLHSEMYYQTPIRTAYEWMEGNILDYIVIKKDSCPIDVSGIWDSWYKRGQLKCCIITKEETLRSMYSEKQANNMIEYYRNTVK